MLTTQNVNIIWLIMKLTINGRSMGDFLSYLYDSLYVVNRNYQFYSLLFKERYNLTKSDYITI